MLKTIKIDSEHSMKLDNNIGWALIYRSQFGHDILPDVMPMLMAVMDIIGSIADSADKKDVREALKSIDKDELEDALIRLASLEVTTFVNICWAMAKLADDDIPEPLEWARTIPRWPMDIIAPALFKVLADGLVSTKNLKKLQTVMAGLKLNNE